MIKIGVIGAGTAGVISILSIIDFLKNKNFFKMPVTIECIHNPNIPVLTVGEVTSTALTRAFQNVFNFNFMSDLGELDGSVRFGNKHTWEDGLGRDFELNYSTPNMHINSEKVGKYVIAKLNQYYSSMFKERHENVRQVIQLSDKVLINTDNEQLEYDYIIDSTGMPTSKELEGGNYAFPDIETVNSVIIYPDFKPYNENFTTVLFHKNGWMFGIPLQHRKAFGYLYNDKITDKEEAIEHFAKLKPDIEVSKLRSLNWRHYYRKTAMDGRILYMGNKVYFFEPSQGLPLHYYFCLSQNFIQYLFDDFMTTADISWYINKYHELSMQKIQDLIAINYAGKNKMTSQFWNETSEKAKNRLKSSLHFREWGQKVTELNFIPWYWSHDPTLMNQYIYAFDIDIKSLIS